MAELFTSSFPDTSAVASPLVASPVNSLATKRQGVTVDTLRSAGNACLASVFDSWRQGTIESRLSICPSAFAICHLLDSHTLTAFASRRDPADFPKEGASNFNAPMREICMHCTPQAWTSGLLRLSLLLLCLQSSFNAPKHVTC